MGKASYDVVITGGGIVGLTLALSLARSRFKTLLIERGPNGLKPSHIRVSAINLASQALFQSLEVWPKLAPYASPYEQIRVFEPSKMYELQFDSSLVARPYLGSIISHDYLSHVLTEKLADYPVEIIYDESVESIELEAKRVFLTLKNGRIVDTQLVVGADGIHSHLRGLLGLSMYERDYRQTALVAQIQTEKPHQKTAWQCFRPQGPLAFLPLEDMHACSIVWSTHPEEAKTLQTLPDKVFAIKLKNAFENRLGEVHLASERFTFPLKMRYTQTFVKPHFALVGDAIHSIHPLAGQGLNLGLQDAAELTNVLNEARDKFSSLGDYSVLRRYARARKSQHLAMIAAMEVFKQGFSVDFFPFRWVRGKMMQRINEWDSFKRLCVGYAGTGWDGHLDNAHPSQSGE